MAGHDKRGKQGLSLFLLCGTVFMVVSQNVKFPANMIYLQKQKIKQMEITQA